MPTDVTDATLERDVVERSTQVPVVVDLWAPWCGPCKVLGPIIENAVAETAGQVELAKINVDENPRAAQAFRVQGIPAVHAVRDRAVVDSFVGAQPEHTVREFVQRLVPDEQANQLAALIEAGDEASLRQAVELAPDDEGAVCALAELLVDRGDQEEALALLARLPETPRVRQLAARARVGDVGSGAGDVEQRLEALLDRVKGDDAARAEFVDLLELLGPDHPRTNDYRRRLAARLY